MAVRHWARHTCFAYSSRHAHGSCARQPTDECEVASVDPIAAIERTGNAAPLIRIRLRAFTDSALARRLHNAVMARIRNPILGMRLQLVLLGLLLAIPAGYAAGAAGAQDSIPAARLANWEPVDEQTLLVWTLHDSRAHLVRLDHPIQGLLDAATIVLVTPSTYPNICACGLEELMVPGAGAARITSVRYLSEKRTAELDPGASIPVRAGMTVT
jgi:Family of unknown function (DUF6491)